MTFGLACCAIEMMASGAARYIDDLSFPGLLHARTIRSTIPAGAIADISFNFNTAGFTIVDHRDVPGRNIVALIDDDQPCLAERAIRHVAEVIGCTPAEVDDVVTYYAMFFRQPVGKYVVQVCRTLSCALRGAERRPALRVIGDGLVEEREVHGGSGIPPGRRARD